MDARALDLARGPPALEGDAIPLHTVAVCPNWVGDVVMALPAIEALAASGRRVTALARPHLHPLLGLTPTVSATIEKGQADAETIAALRRGGFDEAVILPNSFRSAWLAFRAGIPRRWGYRGGLRGALLRPAVARPRGERPQVADYRELLEAMAVEAPRTWSPNLELSDQRRQRGAALLARAGMTADGGPRVAVFPGAEFGPSKRWPWRRFAETLRELRRRRSDLRPVILAGPKEVWLAVRVYEETAKLPPVIGPDLDLADLAAVISHLDLLISNDSGPMHLAAALGVPCLALFGPTDPARTAPQGARHEVLYTDRWCSPCFRRRCPLLHHRCLRDIEVARVVDAGERILAGETPA